MDAHEIYRECWLRTRGLSFDEMAQVGAESIEGWPEILGERPECDREDSCLTRIILQAIAIEAVGDKAILRKIQKDLTDRQFEDWYESRESRHKASQTISNFLSEQSDDEGGNAQEDRKDSDNPMELIIVTLIGLCLGCLLALL